MEDFTELQHAYIVARFFKRLIEMFEDRGLQAFILATHKYAEQRGSRMAQRAIRDGKPLTFATYREYGEWQSTEAADNLMGGFLQDVISNEPDYEVHIKACPWAFQFAAMGMQECGVIYCAHLDKALARGFNPYLVFDVPQSVNNHDCCIQIMRDVDFTENQVFNKDSKNVKGFDYHCGHVFSTFSSLVKSIFGEAGAQISQDVLHDFSQAYGENAAQTLKSFETLDFNTID
ncbi:MAG: hypothetical protein EOM59_00705 [Clostridia bacterium]|nr:hypothetical protein [Clostridia bacterium]